MLHVVRGPELVGGLVPSPVPPPRCLPEQSSLRTGCWEGPPVEAEGPRFALGLQLQCLGRGPGPLCAQGPLHSVPPALLPQGHTHYLTPGTRVVPRDNGEPNSAQALSSPPAKGSVVAKKTI